MKKLLLSALILFSVWGAPGARAQMAVTAPILEGIMSATHLDQAAYYAQSIAQMVENAMNTYNQFQNMLRMEQMALDNLRNVTRVNSWDDFMDWYNRQLYLERQAETRFNRMGVRIGGRTYRLADVAEIPAAMESTYVDYWDNEFSERQRREMWLNLGLTPANYVYVQTWKAREETLARNIMTKLELMNEEHMRDTEQDQATLARLEEDRSLPESERMGEKGLLSLLAEAALNTNRVLRQISYDTAEFNEYQLSRDRQSRTPPNPPDLSEMWGRSLFEPIAEE
ncbi:MAG: hypothetical protein LBQ35_06180 [Spirochaetaceae bacterium]|jgi:hypothetical protein|nr:hypothetical protein [Spirochaetaceae bacterium]